VVGPNTSPDKLCDNDWGVGAGAKTWLCFEASTLIDRPWMSAADDGELVRSLQLHKCSCKADRPNRRPYTARVLCHACCSGPQVICAVLYGKEKEEPWRDLQEDQQERET
jgi:hypothetical protein